MRNLLLTMFVFVSGTLLAGELEDVKMADKVEMGGQELVLNGMGVREVTRFGIPIDVYVAGLYLTEFNSDAQAIIHSDQPKRLVMQFVRRVDKEKLEDAWRKGLHKSCVAECDKYKANLKQLNDLMVDMLDGSQITLDFHSDHVAVTVKGRSSKTGKINSTAFPKNLMAVFIGEKSPGKKFVKGLVGNHPKKKEKKKPESKPSKDNKKQDAQAEGDSSKETGKESKSKKPKAN